tara:strand:+ start:10071 stop:11024 length:954 start_codon:yes stop_codon:yes gene_type:complete
MHLDHQNLRLHLCGCVTLAQQIQHFFPNLLINPKHGTVDIYIAGSAIFESVNYGDNYRALSLFLPQIEFLNAVHIHLIGPDIEFESFDTEAVLDNSVGQNIKIFRSSKLLGEYIAQNGLPDLLTLNHPGFEATRPQYLVDDNGLVQCLENEIPIAGCSYSDDEAEIDQIEMKSQGVCLLNITDNPLLNDTSEGSGIHMSDQAGQIWQLKKGNLKVDHELLELLNYRYQVHEDRCHFFEDRHHAHVGIYSEIEGKHYYWIHPDLFFCSSDFTLLEDNQVVLTDIELDATYLSADRTSMLNSSLICAIIRRDYINISAQ